jgi:hypothetical protein
VPVSPSASAGRTRSVLDERFLVPLLGIFFVLICAFLGIAGALS